jgi:hypothetical protein
MTTFEIFWYGMIQLLSANDILFSVSYLQDNKPPNKYWRSDGTEFRIPLCCNFSVWLSPIYFRYRHLSIWEARKLKTIRWPNTTKSCLKMPPHLRQEIFWTSFHNIPLSFCSIIIRTKDSFLAKISKRFLRYTWDISFKTLFNLILNSLGFSDVKRNVSHHQWNNIAISDRRNTNL